MTDTTPPRDDGPAAADSPQAAARPRPGITRLLALAVLVAGLAFGAAFTIGRAARPGAASGRSASPTPTRPPTTDPQAGALTKIALQPDDTPSLSVELVPGGSLVKGQPTLDVCNASYPSESLRTARLQDVAVDSTDTVVLSTEAVLYKNADATAQAFSELQRARADCPDTPVASKSGGDPVTTRFDAAPDASWPTTPGVTRLAYSLETTDTSGRTRHTVAVYLRHGRALLGLYFSQPDGAQPPVAGATTLPAIVSVLAGRLAAFTSTAIHT